MLSCYLTLKMRLSALFGRVCILTFSLGWFSSLKLNLEIFGQWPINWMTNGYKSWIFFVWVCSANVPTVYDYEAVIVGSLYAHKFLVLSCWKFFFLVLPIMYYDKWNNSFMYGVLRIEAICILLLILLVCTIMVGWIVCCVPSQMTSIFFPSR